MDGATSESQDWHVPAMLVAIIVMLGLVAAIVFAVRATGGEDDSVAAQIERWSSCLRSEGANVPLVEALRDGGFRVTVDGSLVEDGIDRGALGTAMEKCEDQAPDAVRRVMSLLDGLSDFPLGNFDPGSFRLDEARGLPFSSFDVTPGRRDQMRRDLSEICERIGRNGVGRTDISPRLLRLCDSSS